MALNRHYGIPVIIGGFDNTAWVRGLSRVNLQQAGQYNEAWLQRLIMRHPSLLPIEQIEPALVPAIPVCMEMPVPSGFIDNFYVTPAGDLVVGETKLFRNPQQRREVIGQVIDYAKDLSAWSYEDLDKAILRATPANGDPKAPRKSLYEIVAAEAGEDVMDEGRFVDAVSRNLTRGRFLLLVVGDGIQEGVENIAKFIQQHAGLHFTLGLIELAIFELPAEKQGGYVVQPRILARTTNIDRGIVSIQGSQITIKPPVSAQTAAKTGETARRTSITEERFYEELEGELPGITPRLKSFLERLEPLGVNQDFGRGSMILRWYPDETRAWNLGSIITNGKVWTDFLNGQADSIGQIQLAHAYLKKLADAIPGAYVKEGSKPTHRYVAKGQTYVTIDALLAHEEVWIDAIKELTSAVAVALKSA